MLNSRIYYSPDSTKNTNSSLLISQVYGGSISPKRPKIQDISLKLSQFHLNEQYSYKKVPYEERINQLNDKFQKAYINDDQRIISFQNQLNKISEKLANEQNIRNNNIDNFRKKELKQLESHVKNELMKDKIKRTETEDQYSKDIEIKVNQLRENVDNERRERDIHCQKIIGRIGEQVLSVQETLNIEKQQRQDNQNQMQMMINQITNILSLQLAEEQKQRDDTERTIINLLNETCDRIENSLKM
ncbi:unnamed protein product [Paramecium sonneborni]|uniref:Uncharacterized protein n=1 Tax=Paramecium sonneborni TaxID=65129 RepID=A0A8S1M2M8_9CILI|nr:unnamed protein product [Paramecium sonneborni]